MSTLLCLLRHGRATGHGPDAALMPEGAAYVRALGRMLREEGFRPVASYCSPYLRARDTATIVLSELVERPNAIQLSELTPDHDPADALATLRVLGLPDGPVLVVAHLPLVGLMTQMLTSDDPGFSPGTMAMIELNERRSSGKLLRLVTSDQVPGY